MFKQPKSNARGAINKEVEEKQKNGIYGLFMMFVGALIAVMIGMFLYLSPFFNKKDPALNAPTTVVPIEQTPKDDYQFYEILPKQEFESPPQGLSLPKDLEQETQQELPVDSVVEAPTAENIEVVEEAQTYEGMVEYAPKVTYILQVRSYYEAMEADQKRAEVMMAGVDAQVVKRYAGGETIYQVISSAMDKNEAMLAYERLKSNGIDSLIVEQKH